MAHSLEKAGYAATKLPDIDGAAAGALDFEVLIFAATHWDRVKRMVAETTKNGTEDNLAPIMMVCGSPNNNDWSAESLREPDEFTTLLPYPVDTGVLVYQMKSALHRRKSTADIRYRLREREDVPQEHLRSLLLRGPRISLHVFQ